MTEIVVVAVVVVVMTGECDYYGVVVKVVLAVMVVTGDRDDSGCDGSVNFPVS